MTCPSKQGIFCPFVEAEAGVTCRGLSFPGWSPACSLCSAPAPSPQGLSTWPCPTQSSLASSPVGGLGCSPCPEGPGKVRREEEHGRKGYGWRRAKGGLSTGALGQPPPDPRSPRPWLAGLRPRSLQLATFWGLEGSPGTQLCAPRPGEALGAHRCHCHGTGLWVTLVGKAGRNA